MRNKPFVIERTYNASAEEVWKAITDKDEMKQWYFNIEQFELEVGFEFSFLAGSEDKEYLHKCIITEVVQVKKLSCSWKYEGYEGNSVVTFNLFPQEASTKLKLTHEGLETFPVNNPDFAKESFSQGWNYITNTSLKEFLDKH